MKRHYYYRSQDKDAVTVNPIEPSVIAELSLKLAGGGFTEKQTMAAMEIADRMRQGTYRDNITTFCMVDIEAFAQSRLEPLDISDTDVLSWFERDRQQICLVSTITDNTFFELWDDDVTQFVEDGFKTRQQSWHDALYAYCAERDLLPYTLYKGPT